MCRWSIKNKNIREIPSQKYGIPGIFYFKNKNILNKLPKSGEFVRWYSNNIKKFNHINIENLKEIIESILMEKENKNYSGKIFLKLSPDEKKSISSAFKEFSNIFELICLNKISKVQKILHTK